MSIHHWSEWDRKVLAEAKLLCLAYCRAAHCVDSHKCRAGAEGPFHIYKKEARQRLLAKLMDTA